MTFLKVMLFVLTMLSVFVYIAFNIPSQRSMPPEEIKFDPALIKTKNDLVQIGQNLFFSKGQCALCHTLGGGVKSRCPDLTGIGGKLTREFEYESYTKPSAWIYMDYEQESGSAKRFPAQMPEINKPPVDLNEKEILAVFSFIQSQGGEVTVDLSEIAPPKVAVAATGDLANGKKVFGRLDCVKCHMIGDQVKGKGSDILPVIGKFDEPALKARLLEPPKKEGEAKSQHKDFDQRLSIKDLNDLLSYLLSFKPAPVAPAAAPSKT